MLRWNNVSGAPADLYANAQYHRDCHKQFFSERNTKTAQSVTVSQSLPHLPDVDPPLAVVIGVMHEQPARVWNSAELHQLYGSIGMQRWQVHPPCTSTVGDQIEHALWQWTGCHANRRLCEFAVLPVVCSVSFECGRNGWYRRQRPWTIDWADQAGSQVDPYAEELWHQ